LAKISFEPKKSPFSKKGIFLFLIKKECFRALATRKMGQVVQNKQIILENFCFFAYSYKEKKALHLLYECFIIDL
jgi:hypothetical protein